MHISTHLDAGRQADLARDPNHLKGVVEHAALRSIQAKHPRFAATSCSQCGQDTGPGDGGFSHCADHRARDAQRALFGTINRAVQPASIAQRFAYDSDYGAFADHPMDPRSPCDCCDEVMTADEAKGEATDQILSFAESVADWLAKACDCDEGRIPLDVSALEPLQIIEGSPALLMTVLMNGDNSQVLRAVHKLREMAAKNFAAEIDERAAQLLAEAA